jgi:hypothetical protein
VGVSASVEVRIHKKKNSKRRNKNGQEGSDVRQANLPVSGIHSVNWGAVVMSAKQLCNSLTNSRKVEAWRTIELCTRCFESA